MSDDFELLSLEQEVLSLSESDDSEGTDGGTAVIEAVEDAPQSHNLQGMFLNSLPHFYPNMMVFGRSPPAAGQTYSVDLLGSSPGSPADASSSGASAARCSSPMDPAAGTEQPAAALASETAAAQQPRGSRACAPPPASQAGAASTGSAPSMQLQAGHDDMPAALQAATDGGSVELFGDSADARAGTGTAAVPVEDDDFEDLRGEGLEGACAEAMPAGNRVLQDTQPAPAAGGSHRAPQPDAKQDTTLHSNDDDTSNDGTATGRPAAAPSQWCLLLGVLLLTAALAMGLLLLSSAAGSASTGAGLGFQQSSPYATSVISLAAAGTNSQRSISTRTTAAQHAPRVGSTMAGQQEHEQIRMLPVMLAWRLFGNTSALYRGQSGKTGAIAASTGTGAASTAASPLASITAQLPLQLRQVAGGSSHALLSPAQRLRLQLWLLHLAQQQHGQASKQQTGLHHGVTATPGYNTAKGSYKELSQLAFILASTCNTTAAGGGMWWLAPAAPSAHSRASNSFSNSTSSHDSSHCSWMLLRQLAANVPASNNSTCAVAARCSPRPSSWLADAPAIHGNSSSSSTGRKRQSLAAHNSTPAAAAKAAAVASLAACDAPMMASQQAALHAAAGQAAHGAPAAPASLLLRPTPPLVEAATVAMRPRFIIAQPTRPVPQLYRPPLPCLRLGAPRKGLRQPAAKAGDGTGTAATARHSASGMSNPAVRVSHPNLTERHHSAPQGSSRAPNPAAAAGSKVPALAGYGAVGRWLLQQLPAAAVGYASSLPWLPLLSHSNNSLATRTAPGKNGSSSSSRDSVGVTLPMLPAAGSHSGAAAGSGCGAGSNGVTLPMLPPVACSTCSKQLQLWGPASGSQPDGGRCWPTTPANQLRAQSSVARKLQLQLPPPSHAHYIGIDPGTCAAWEEPLHLPHHPHRKLLALQHDDGSSSSSGRLGAQADTCSSSGDSSASGSFLLVHTMVPITAGDAAAAAAGSSRRRPSRFSDAAVAIRHQLGLTYEHYEDEDDYEGLNSIFKGLNNVLPDDDDATSATAQGSDDGLLNEVFVRGQRYATFRQLHMQADSPCGVPALAAGAAAMAAADGSATARTRATAASSTSGAAVAATVDPPLCVNNGTVAAALAAAARLAAAAGEVNAFLSRINRMILGAAGGATDVHLHTAVDNTAGAAAKTPQPSHYARCMYTTSSHLEPLIARRPAAPTGTSTQVPSGTYKVPVDQWVASFVTLPMLPPKQPANTQHTEERAGSTTLPVWAQSGANGSASAASGSAEGAAVPAGTGSSGGGGQGSKQWVAGSMM